MRLGAKVTAVVATLGLGLVGVTATTASADTQSTSKAPYTCTTSPNLGTQAASFSATASDSVDPAAPGQSETYRFVVPFAQDKLPVTATYKGGSTSWRIPSGLTVTGAHMETPPGGSPISSTVKVQGDSVIVTSTGSVPIDGSSYPTPDLVVNGTVQNSAAGVGIKWLVPYQLVATVDVQGFGTVTATCSPDSPSTVVASTTVPAGPKAPVAKDQNVALPQDTSKQITLSATDADTPANQLTYAIATQPTHGTLTGTPPTVTYAPATHYVGPDSFTFTATDPEGNKGTGTVSINVFSNAVVDNTPPTVTVTTPQNGAVYTPGQVVNADYACTDATTGIKSCTGNVATGSAISTTIGVHTFVVNAFDNANNPARRTVSYRVVDTALVTSSVTSLPIDCGSLALLAPTTIPVSASAPTQVGTGRTMTFRVSLGSQSVPALTTATNITYVFAAPTNGTVTAAAIRTGTGTANARPGATVTVASNVVTLTLPGPIAGGTTSATAFTPPSFDVTVKASSTAGKVVQTKFARFKQHTVVGIVNRDFDCAAGNSNTANPTITSTTVIDTTPPTVLIGRPDDGQLIDQGASVTANYGCSDDVSLSSCTGTTANGAAIDTATAGIKTYSVQAKDAAGNIAASFVSYTVLSPTVTYTAHFPSTSASLLDATAAAYGTTRANLPKVAVAVFAYVDAVNPGWAHPVTPPPTDGTLAIGTTYPRAQAPVITALAGKWGMDPDTFHTYATIILCYIYSVNAS
jgi:hypothetical protein